MTFARVPLSMITDPKMTHRQFRVYCYISSLQARGIEWKSQRDMEAELGICGSNIADDLNRLKVRGLVTKQMLGKRTHYACVPAESFRVQDSSELEEDIVVFALSDHAE